MVQEWQKVGPPILLLDKLSCILGELGQVVQHLQNAQKYGLSMSVQKFRSPEGNVGDYYLIDHPTWAVVCPITDDKKVVLVKQFKQGANEVIWEFPAGRIEDDQTPQAAAMAELMQETGYSTDEANMTETGKIWMSTRKSSCYFHTFVATECKRSGSQNLDAGEGMVEVQAVCQREFWRMVRDGEIQEASTLNAALFALLGGQLAPTHIPGEAGPAGDQSAGPMRE